MSTTPGAKPEEYKPEEYKVAFDFYKQLTTLNLAAIGFTLVLLDQGIIPKDRLAWVISDPIFFFGVSLVLSLASMVFFDAPTSKRNHTFPRILVAAPFILALVMVLNAAGMFKVITDSGSGAATAPSTSAR
jgi:hypothetical protein